MLKCSSFGCTDPPITQCNNANGHLLCNKCIPIHSEKHQKDNKILCYFGEIKSKLPKSKFKNLRNSIEESISEIEKQKQKIMNEAYKVHSQVGNLVKQAINFLDQMIKNYTEIYNKTIYNEKDCHIIETIIKRKIVFEYPFFSKVEGVLTKNTLFFYKLIMV